MGNTDFLESFKPPLSFLRHEEMMPREIQRTFSAIARGAEHIGGLGELYTAYIEGVEGIAAVCATFQTVFLSLGELLTPLVFLAIIDSCCLDADQQILIVLTVEEGHEGAATREAPVDEQMLLQMPHGATDIDRSDCPPQLLKLMDDDPLEVFFVDSIVGTKGCVVVVEDDFTGTEVVVVGVEVFTEGFQLTLILNPERLDHVETTQVVVWLADDEPVDVGIEVEGNAEWLMLKVAVHAAVLKLQLLEVIAEAVKVVEIGTGIDVPRTHGTVEAIFQQADATAEDGGLEGERGKVTLHLFDELDAKHLKVDQRGVFLVEDGTSTKTGEGCFNVGQFLQMIRGERCTFLADLPLTAKQTLYEVDELGVHLVGIVEEPGSFLGDGHIAGDEHAVMPRTMVKLLLLATVGWKGLILQLIKVYVLGFVDVKPVKAFGVGGAGTILRNDEANGTRVEADDIFPVLGRNEGRRPVERLGGTMTDAPVDIPLVTPTLQMLQHGGKGVGEGAFGVGCREGTCGAWHGLYVAEGVGCMYHALANATTANNDGVLSSNSHHLQLHVVEIFLSHGRVRFLPVS